MGKIPGILRLTIAANIRACRLEKFPGRGGAKQCAEAFSAFIGKNISPQQWSPWERGMRTPDESRLEQIAAFFEKSVECMRRNTRPPAPGAPSSALGSPPPLAAGVAAESRQTVAAVPADTPPEASPYARMSAPELLVAMGRDKVKAVYQVEVSVSSVRFVPCGGSG